MQCHLASYFYHLFRLFELRTELQIMKPLVILSTCNILFSVYVVGLMYNLHVHVYFYMERQTAAQRSKQCGKVYWTLLDGTVQKVLTVRFQMYYWNQIIYCQNNNKPRTDIECNTFISQNCGLLFTKCTHCLFIL